MNASNIHPQAAHEGDADVTDSRNKLAPFTVRLLEPAGSSLRCDVRLRVDYINGNADDRAARIVSSLLETSQGKSLGLDDRESLKSQLGDWLASNAAALHTGHTLYSNPFSFTRSISDAPPPRPPPETAPPPQTQSPAPAGRSGASTALPRHRK
jgi:hypothetical protein